jgi:GntR family transcriptional regulator, rspAB operon transcriptional repressor
VGDHLRERILDGQISPGSRLIEAQLARDLGVSRTPVREALHLLESEGLLESIPRVGYTVRGVDVAEAEEICDIRAVNEILAAEWAIARMTEPELDALETRLVQAESEVWAGDTSRYPEHDAEFHETIARASGSNRLLELCRELRRHMLRFRLESLARPKVAAISLAGHRRIFECLRARDREGVALAIRGHLEDAKRNIRAEVLEGGRTRGLGRTD